ncbi:MAG: hypothetical protein ACHQ1G_00890 [Planctomycetota bacterium]
MKDREPLIEDRVLTVYSSLEGERGRGLVMHTCSLRQVGGRTLLVGTCADTGGDEKWSSGVEAALPWDSVVLVYSMTREQFEAMRDRRGGARHERKP